MFIKELDYTIDLSKIVYIKRSDAFLPPNTSKEYISKPCIIIIFDNNIKIWLYYDNNEILNERYNYISNLLVENIKQ